MDKHEQEENDLQKLAETKYFNHLCDIADDSHSFTDDGVDEFHDKADAMRTGLRKGGGKKKLWCVCYGVGDEDDEPVDDPDYVFMFIAKSKAEIQKKIEALPDRLTEEQRNALVAKVEATYKCRFAEFEYPNSTDCKLVVDSSEEANAFHNKTIDGIRLCAVIDPKKYRPERRRVMQ